MLRMLPKFPGNKANPRYYSPISLLLDAYNSTRIWEPYAGTGAIGLNYLHYDSGAILHTYDTDPTVSSLWEYAMDVRNPRQLKYVEGFFSGHYDMRCLVTNWVKGDKETPRILALYLYENALAGSPMASLLLRRLAFGGVIRTTKAGKPNSYIPADAMKWLRDILKGDRKSPIWYTPPARVLDRVRWSPRITSHLDAAIIDPPYYLDDRTQITPCYPGHKPHDLGLLGDSLSRVHKAVEMGARLVFYFNYASDALMHSLGLRPEDRVSFISRGLNTLNKYTSADHCVGAKREICLVFTADNDPGTSEVRDLFSYSAFPVCTVNSSRFCGGMV